MSNARNALKKVRAGKYQKKKIESLDDSCILIKHLTLEEDLETQDDDSIKRTQKIMMLGLYGDDKEPLFSSLDELMSIDLETFNELLVSVFAVNYPAANINKGEAEEEKN